jgi:uncharacterized protein
MAAPVLRAALDLAFRHARRPQLDILWHAGEPTTVPVDYYYAAFQDIEQRRPSDLAIKHHFQVNGTLVTDEWCNLFRDHSTTVGISIDGPADLHDKHRRRRNGRGTFDQVVASIDLLQRSDVEVHFLAVLTRDSVRTPDRLFWFFEGIGAEVIGFNIEERESANAHSSLAYDHSIADYRAFLQRYLDLIEVNGSKQRVREVEEVAARIAVSTKKPIENELVEPFAIMSIDVGGNISTFCPELLTGPHPERGHFVIGNVMQHTLTDLLQGSQFQRLHDEIRAGVQMCATTCSYFSICGGGAPVNKLWENGRFDSTETDWCRFRIMGTTEVILDRLSKQLMTVEERRCQNGLA